LRNAPTTENGVIFAFGRVADKLGFEVERIQTAFPDCEALREVAPGKRQREKVEFELFSRNFLEHQHEGRCATPGPPGAPFFARAGADHCVLGA